MTLKRNFVFLCAMFLAYIAPGLHNPKQYIIAGVLLVVVVYVGILVFMSRK